MTLPGLHLLFAELPGPYRFHLSQSYTPEMDSWRAKSSPEANTGNTNHDAFDDRAWHLTIEYKGQLAAYSRMIPGSDAYFRQIINVQGLMNTSDSIDWSRLVVPPAFKGLGLPLAMGYGCTLLAQATGMRYIHAAAEPARGLTSLIKLLGYCPVGEPSAILVPSPPPFKLQLFLLDLALPSLDLSQQPTQYWQSLALPKS